MGFQPPSQIWCTIGGTGLCQPLDAQLASSTRRGLVVNGGGSKLANSKGDDSTAECPLPPNATPRSCCCCWSSSIASSAHESAFAEAEPAVPAARLRMRCWMRATQAITSMNVARRRRMHAEGRAWRSLPTEERTRDGIIDLAACVLEYWEDAAHDDDEKSEMTSPFAYQGAQYKTIASCKKSGCTLDHLELKSVAATVGRAWLTEERGTHTCAAMRPGRNLRVALREAANAGSIKGTNVGIRKTSRMRWYWHAGDPDIQKIRELLIDEVPANPEMVARAEVCAICLESMLGTQESSSLYSKINICPHVFHRECISSWFSASEGQCPLCRQVHEEVGCTTCGETGDMVVCAHCPKVFHVAEPCLQGDELARAQSSLDHEAWDWMCPPCHNRVAVPPAPAPPPAAAAPASTLTPAAAAAARARAGPRCNGATASSSSAASSSSGRAVVTAAPLACLRRGGRAREHEELQDDHKASNEAKRAKKAMAETQWAEGDCVDGRHNATRGGHRWYPGRIQAVKADPRQKGLHVYHIVYDDGDEEHDVLPRNVRAST